MRKVARAIRNEKTAPPTRFIGSRDPEKRIHPGKR
jgi:hypothetical protein